MEEREEAMQYYNDYFDDAGEEEKDVVKGAWKSGEGGREYKKILAFRQRYQVVGHRTLERIIPEHRMPERRIMGHRTRRDTERRNAGTEQSYLEDRTDCTGGNIWAFPPFGDRRRSIGITLPESLQQYSL